MQKAGLDEAQAGIKIVGRNINNLRYTGDATLRAESEEELKSLLMKVKEWKSWLKTQISKTKIMASGPITSWQIDGETVETVKDLILGAPKSLQMLTAAIKDPCSLEEKLWPTETAYFANRGPSSQSYSFSSSHVWIWELDHKESWVLKNWWFFNCVEEDSWEPFGQKGDQTSQS